MANQFSINARSHYDASRQTKVFDKGRLCENEDCVVTLSQYNPSDRCYLHAPKKVGRIRGHKDQLKDK